MTEINKINANQPFEVRLTQPSPDRRQQRETTVNDQDASPSKEQAQPKKRNLPPDKKSRQDSAMEDMLEALRKEQHLEDDLREYKDRQLERYRESNKQASEEYLRNQREGKEVQNKRVLQDQAEDQDAHKKYHSRIQDISRAHIDKLLKSKLDQSQHKDLNALQKSPGQSSTEDPDASPNPPPRQRLDTSRLRPEVARLLEAQRQERGQPAAEPPSEDLPASQKASTQESTPESRQLLEGALGKLRQRLGGAHQNTSKGIQAPPEFKPVLNQPTISSQPQTAARPQAAPIRADLNQVQAAMQRSRALEQAADGSRYIPLEDGDVQKLLLENKLPVTYQTVQAIRLASRSLQDSSYHFQRAAVLLAQVGLPIETQAMTLVSDALRMYEKYQRASIINKLYRYLQTRKMMQLYQQLSTPQRQPSVDIGKTLLNRQQMPAASLEQQAQNTAVRQQMQTVQAQAEVGRAQLPDDLAPPALKSAIEHLLKTLGLPVNKIMVKQLVQSADFSYQRAQALVFQLAAGRPLKGEQIDVLQQKLAAMPAGQQQEDPVVLMEKLGLPVPDKVRQAASRSADLPLLERFASEARIPWRAIESQPAARDALLRLHTLAVRSNILPALLPELAKMLNQSGPETLLQRLITQQPRIEQLLARIPTSTAMALPPARQGPFIRALLLALELPTDHTRGWERLQKMLTALVPKSSLPADAAPANAAKSAGAGLPINTSGLRADTGTSPQPATGAGTQPQTERAGHASAPSARGSLAQNKPPVKTAGSTDSAAPLSTGTGNQHPTAITLPQALAAVYTWPETVPPALGPAREALMLLHAAAERHDLLNVLIPRLNNLLQQAPAASLKALARFASVLQASQRQQTLDSGGVTQVLKQIETAAQPQTPPVTAASSTPTPTLNENQLLQTLQRFYPDMPVALRESLPARMQNASPELLDSFYQLHRLLGMLDPGKAQSLSTVWEHPQVFNRLARLGVALRPVLDSLSPEKQYFLPLRLQNQLIQGLQNHLLSGKSDSLRAALQHWLQPDEPRPISWGRMQEQLKALGVGPQTDTVYQDIWRLGQGSRDRVDAMGLLLRGGFPLLENNIQTLLPTLRQLSPEQRSLQAADLLHQHAAQLSDLRARPLPPDQLLGRLQALLELQAPLIPERLTQQPLQSSNGLSQNFQLETLLALIPRLSAQLPGPSAQALQTLLAPLQALSESLQQAPQKLDLPVLLQQLEQLQRLRPALPQQSPQAAQLLASPEAVKLQSLPPVQAWSQLLQPVASQAQQLVLVQQFQDQLSGLYYQLQQIIPRLQNRLQQAAPLTEAQPEGLPKTLASPQAQTGQDLQQLQAYLRQWGLNIQTPEQLVQIQQWAQGVPERLDAVTILLRGHVPVLPAHIEIVAQYVKQLPPYERFQSISKILSFLSDELLAQMKTRLQEQRLPPQARERPEGQKAQLQQWLDQSQQPLSESRLQAAQLLQQMGTPPGQNALNSLQQTLQIAPLPQQMLGPVQQILGQLLSLLPRDGAPVNLHPLLESLEALQAQLRPQPQQQALSQWLSSVSGQLSRLSEDFQKQVRELGKQTEQNQPTEDDGWLDNLLKALLGLTDWLAAEEPHKAAQAQKMRQLIQQQLQSLRGSLNGLAQFHEQEAQAPLAPQPLLTQYVPAMIAQMDYPVEILLSQEKAPDASSGERQTEVQLAVQTHTLGQIYLSLTLKKQRLAVAVAVENLAVCNWLRPYAEGLRHKLQNLPWELEPVKLSVMPAEHKGAPVMAQHLYRRYGQQAIDAL
ncbi:MAG: hypothetical protein IGS03_12310 [Candidatus Sericytochromatia bacterium]|nr:hypothetical protein [Candidatus Sericytochromatia bacterium]